MEIPDLGQLTYVALGRQSPFQIHGPCRIPAQARTVRGAVRSRLTCTDRLESARYDLSGSYHAFGFRTVVARHLAAFAYRFNRRFELSTLTRPLLVAAATCAPQPQRPIRAEASCQSGRLLAVNRPRNMCGSQSVSVLDLFKHPNPVLG